MGHERRLDPDGHALAVVDARAGAVIAQTTTAANACGYQEAVRFADRHAPGDRLWAIEAREHGGRPRGGEHQEALRLLLLARRTAVETRKVAFSCRRAA